MISVVRINQTEAGLGIDPSAISEMLDDGEALLWIDANSPTPDELSLLIAELQLHPLALDDMAMQYGRARIEQFGDTYFLALYAARERPGPKPPSPDSLATLRIEFQRVNAFVARNYLLTVHDEACPEVLGVIERMRKAANGRPNDIGLALYALLDTIVDDYFPLIDDISEQMTVLEESIFADGGSSTLEQIFQLKKDMLAYRRLVTPLRDVVNVLLRAETALFSEKGLLYLRDVYDHLVRITENVDTYRDILSSAVDAHLSAISNRLAESSNRLNQTMQTLTAWSIILMSAGVIAGVYGMNFTHIPELRWQFGYAFAVGLIVCVGVGLFAYFKRRGWL